MKKDERKEFDEWYKTVKDKTFIFDEEIIKYCYSNVRILREACLKFRSMLMEITGCDPFCYITIAQCAMAIYRTLDLPEKTIGIHDEPADKFSKESIQWLKTLPEYENIRHGLNGGEVKILGRKVDGYDSTTNTVYQFYGCFWHGCPTL